MTFIVDTAGEDELRGRLRNAVQGLSKADFQSFLGNGLDQITTVSLDSLAEMDDWYIEEVNIHLHAFENRLSVLIEERLLPALDRALDFKFDSVQWWPQGRTVTPPIRGSGPPWGGLVGVSGRATAQRRRHPYHASDSRPRAASSRVEGSGTTSNLMLSTRNREPSRCGPGPGGSASTDLVVPTRILASPAGIELYVLDISCHTMGTISQGGSTEELGVTTTPSTKRSNVLGRTSP